MLIYITSIVFLSELHKATATAGACNRELKQFHKYAVSISPNYWAETFRVNNQKFDDAVVKFSDAMYKCNAHFQFVSVGSCDGTSDSAIQAFYDRKHWNAVFVEASPPNVMYLKEKLVEKQTLDRSFVLHVAALEQCSKPTVDFARPINFNETTAKHWLRRQVGRVPEGDKATEFFKKKSNKWAVDTVQCMTGSDIISEWERKSPIPTKIPGITRRAHFLKIDVEGASFGVLKSFMSGDFTAAELPIFVMTEVKTAPGELEDMCNAARQLLSGRGYIVSKCAQDLFAMLRPENILL